MRTYHAPCKGDHRSPAIRQRRYIIICTANVYHPHSDISSAIGCIQPPHRHSERSASAVKNLVGLRFNHFCWQKLHLQSNLHAFFPSMRPNPLFAMFVIASRKAWQSLRSELPYTSRHRAQPAIRNVYHCEPTYVAISTKAQQIHNPIITIITKKIKK